MESRVNYTLVGLFVIGLGATLASIIIWLTVGTEDKTYHTYRVYTPESVAGLNPGASVKYRGVDVGRVQDIELDPAYPQRVTIELEIEQGTPIRQDTTAKLVTQGLTGLAYVELTGGSPSAPPLEPEPGEPPPVIQAGPSLVARLDDAFTNFQETFNTLSDRVESLLSPENQQILGQILRNVSTITGAVAGRTSSIEQTLINLETTTNTLAEHSGNLGRAIDSAVSALEDSAQMGNELTRLLTRIGSGANAVEEMAKAITQTSKTLVQTAEESQQQIFELAKSTTPELNNLLAQLNLLAYTVERFIEELERNPRMLLLGRPSGRPGPGE